MLEVKDGNFILNGRKTILFGGEVHYFRLPESDWEDRIIKVKQAGGNLVSSYIPWMIHEDVKGDIDFDGRRRSGNNLGLFLQLIQKHGMYCLLRPGPYIMSELKNEGLPAWLYEDFKDSLALNKDGSIHPTNSVYLLDTEFLGLVEKWYEALGKAVKPYMSEAGGPVIMVQLDNEIGMMHWCSGTPDYTPENIRNLHSYMKAYCDDKAAIKSAGMNEEEFSALVADPPEELAQYVRIDFSRFMREYFKDYFIVLKEKFYRLVGEVPVVLNIHGFDSADIVKRGKRYPIGVAQLSQAAGIPETVTAGDYYIGNIVYDNCQDIMLADAFTYAVQSKEQPLFSAEFQGGFQIDTPRIQPTSYDLTTRICIADGMNGVNYYMFAGGTNIKGTGIMGMRHSWQAPVDTDGTLRPQYPVIAHLGKMLAACNDSLASTAKEAVVALGLIPDYYMTEYKDEKTKAICDELVFYREEYLYEGMGKAMSVLNISYEGLDLSKDKPLDAAGIPAIAAFMTRHMDPDIQRRLSDYVMEGGKLLAFPTIPVMDMYGDPCTILKDLLGCDAATADFGFASHIDDIEDLIICSSTNFGKVENGFAEHESGYTCGFVKEIGKGMIVAFGVAMQHDFYYRDKVVLNQFEKIGVSPLITTDDIYDKLLLLSRINKDGGRYLFINNIDEYSKTTHIFINGNILFEGKPLCINPRSGLMLPLDIEFSKDLYIRYSTAEITLFESSDGVMRLDLSLTQPEDEIVFRSAYCPIPSDNYSITTIGDGFTRIVSKRHGAIHKSMTIELYALYQ